MKEQLINYQTAILAKEKGFDETCNTYVTESNDYETDNAFYRNSYGYITAPTQSVLAKWLRDIHKIHISVEVVDNARTFHYEYELTFIGNYEYHDEDCWHQAKKQWCKNHLIHLKMLLKKVYMNH